MKKMKKIILISLTLITNFSFGQNPNLGNFNSKFALVANKSTAWNSLIDFLRPTNSLIYFKLTEQIVWKDPCQQIAQQGASCPQVDYINYFKRATGADTIVGSDNQKFIQNYTFETNSRPGNDLTTNIDTIRYATFDWKFMSSNTKLSKKQLKKKYLELYNSIITTINQYYGSPIDETTSNENVLEKKYWTYKGKGTALARIALIYNKKTKDYKITFSGNIQRVD